MMDAKTREALEASIKHWEDNVAADTLDKASVSENDCALCMMFSDCRDGCPVYAETLCESCRSTPYMDAARSWSKWFYGEGPNAGEKFRAAAQKELDFLISLRPED